MIGIGSTVGNYRVVKKLGSGAMGSVFLAEHPIIGKKVALKVIHSDLAENEEMVSRFFNEAKAVTQIGHEHIIEVTDYGQTPEHDNFIVMELLEGRSLGERIKAEKTLPLGEVLDVAVQITDGLEASHQRGIVHRDLKPDNVYLISRHGRDNFVKILDFGLAKLTQGGGALSHKTRAGSVLGTPHYMAPEQCEGKPDIDHRVDVYALGCILYQCLCGRVPFPGEGFGEVLVKHLREPPVMPTKINGQIPRPVEAIILHALAKRKEFRFQSMREMGAALRDPERWIRQLDGEALLRVTGEGEAPDLGSPAPAPRPTAAQPARGPVMKTGDAAPTMVDRPLPEAVQRLDAPRATSSQVATVILEAPQLPTTDGRPAPPLPGAATTFRGDEELVPARDPLARRFMIGAGAAAAVLVATLFGVRVLSPPRAAVPVAAPPPPIALTVNTVPSGAQVLRDGVPEGLSPMILKLPAGTRAAALTLRKAGFLEEQRVIEPEREPVLTVTLRREPTGEGAADAPPAPPPTRTARPPRVAARPAAPAAEAAKPSPRPAAARPHPAAARPRPAGGHARPGDPAADDIMVPSF